MLSSPKDSGKGASLGRPTAYFSSPERQLLLADVSRKDAFYCLLFPAMRSLYESLFTKITMRAGIETICIGEPNPNATLNK